MPATVRIDGIGSPAAEPSGGKSRPRKNKKLVRKPGKLPSETFSKTYDLEYGTDTLEIHRDAIKPGERILIADDLLATGGTMSAVVDMVQTMGGEIVECCFMAELDFLNGRKKLPEGKVFSLLNF